MFGSSKVTQAQVMAFRRHGLKAVGVTSTLLSMAGAFSKAKPMADVFFFDGAPRGKTVSPLF